MMPSRGVVKQIWIESRVVEVVRRFEGRNQHPVKRKREKGNEEHQDCGVATAPGNSADAGARVFHQATSARRANRRNRIETTTRTGSRNSEIAAPPARSPP